MTTDTPSQTEANKKVVTAFYEESHFDADVDGAIARYVGDTYIQHTPAAEDHVLTPASTTPRVGHLKISTAHGNPNFLSSDKSPCSPGSFTAEPDP
jgi:hypothetical protein